MDDQEGRGPVFALSKKICSFSFQVVPRRRVLLLQVVHQGLVGDRPERVASSGSCRPGLPGDEACSPGLYQCDAIGRLARVVTRANEICWGLPCCLRSPGWRTCQIARNITMSRTHRRSVLCDCFTSTSGSRERAAGARFAPTSSTLATVRCVTSRMGRHYTGRHAKSAVRRGLVGEIAHRCSTAPGD